MDMFDLPSDLLFIDRKTLWRRLALVQGDDWIWTVDLLNKPATEYTLTFEWAEAGVSAFSVVSTAEGDSYSFNVPAATTATYTPGMYRVQAYLTNTETGTKHTLGIQEGQIYPNLASIGDPRSANRKALDAVEAALAAAAPGAHIIEYVVGGKTFKRKIEDLMNVRAYYAQRCRVEDGHAIGHKYFSL